MIFLILPVWWVPCFLVPIVLLVSLVPWWYTRGATPKGEPPERTHKKRRGEQHFKHEENKIQIRIVVIPYIVPMFFIERDLLKTCAALRIYPSAENPKKKTCFIGKPCWTPTSTRSVVPDRFMLSALMGSYEKASFIWSWPRKLIHEPKLWRFKFKGFEQGNHIR